MPRESEVKPNPLFDLLIAGVHLCWLDVQSGSHPRTDVPDTTGAKLEQAAAVQKLLSAKTAYLLAVATGPVPERLSPKPLAQEKLTKAMLKWGRFELVSDVERADILLLVIEREEYHSWGNTIVCRDQLFVYQGGASPTSKPQLLWKGDPERWGKFGSCSGAGEPVKELRKELETADKTKH